MTEVEKARTEALEIIEKLRGDHDLKFCLEIALDAIAMKLSTNSLFQSLGIFKNLGIKPEESAIVLVLEALARAKVLSPDDTFLPEQFDDAMANLYEGDTSAASEILTTLHERLKTAIEALVSKQLKPSS